MVDYCSIFVGLFMVGWFLSYLPILRQIVIPVINIHLSWFLVFVACIGILIFCDFIVGIVLLIAFILQYLWKRKKKS